MAYEPTEESPEKIEEKEYWQRNLRIAAALLWLAAILVGVATGSVPAGIATLLGSYGLLGLGVTVVRLLRGETFYSG